MHASIFILLISGRINMSKVIHNDDDDPFPSFIMGSLKLIFIRMFFFRALK